MPVSKAAKNQLHNEVAAYFTPESTEIIMNALPLDDKVATKGDIAALRKATKGDIAALQQATKGDIAALRKATVADIGTLRRELRESYPTRIEMLEGFDRMRNWFVGGTLTLLVILSGLIIGLSRLPG